jgi:ATP adenylyltransferase
VESRPHDQPFLQSEDFFAIASIGALVEGWTLVCTKAHQLNAESQYQRAEFVEFVRATAQLVRDQYGKSPVVFEHGVRCEGSLTGCGTDHAHVHVVPFDDSIERKIRMSGDPWTMVSLEEVSRATSGQEYLMYCGNILEAHPRTLVRRLSHPVSQFFRKVIAESLGAESECDYRKFPYYERATATAALLRTHSRRLQIALP